MLHARSESTWLFGLSSSSCWALYPQARWRRLANDSRSKRHSPIPLDSGSIITDRCNTSGRHDDIAVLRPAAGVHRPIVELSAASTQRRPRAWPRYNGVGDDGQWSLFARDSARVLERDCWRHGLFRRGDSQYSRTGG
jgi:hypothetical protein